MVHTTTLNQLRDHLNKTDLSEYDIVYIHTGVNDIDTVDGMSVADDLINIIEKIRHVYPSIKIIVSDITPRKQFRDDQVLKCNEKLGSSLRKRENITIGFHKNLRNPEWSFHKDDKHFAQVSIAKFASNIKVAFRKSIGLTNNKFKKGQPQEPRRSNTRFQKSKRNEKTNNSVEELKNFFIKSLQNFKG